MPQSFASRYGPWAVVAGASEGLGAAFAEALAARGINLLLLARRAELLESVAERLRTRHKIEVRAPVCDMARSDLPAALEAMTSDLEIGLAVYNAAYAPIGLLVERSIGELDQVIDVNARAPLVFARIFAPKMVARGRGGIVLMSSLAGFQGAPRMAAYTATKAFNIVLGESLAAELGPHGVDAVVCCAGAIRTPGYAKSTAKDSPGIQDASEVAEETLAALGRGAIVVPGGINRLARFVLGRLLPRRAAVAVMARSTRELS